MVPPHALPLARRRAADKIPCTAGDDQFAAAHGLAGVSAAVALDRDCTGAHAGANVSQLLIRVADHEVLRVANGDIEEIPHLSSARQAHGADGVPVHGRQSFRIQAGKIDVARRRSSQRER